MLRIQSCAILLNVLAKETYLLFLGLLCILMRSPCTNGHSPWLIALLANYRPLAPLAMVWLNITNCHPGQAREYWNIPAARERSWYSFFRLVIIYCSKAKSTSFILPQIWSKTSDCGQLCKYKGENWCSPDNWSKGWVSRLRMETWSQSWVRRLLRSSQLPLKLTGYGT